MKITIDEKKFNDCCTEAREIYINRLKKTAEEKGEKMPKLVEVGETISTVIFASELRKIIFECSKSDEKQDKDDSITVRLNLPREFIDHYNRDKFKESLQRIRFDIYRSYNKQIYNPCISGNYEIEILDMLIDMFSDSEIVR